MGASAGLGAGVVVKETDYVLVASGRSTGVPEAGIAAASIGGQAMYASAALIREATSSAAVASAGSYAAVAAGVALLGAEALWIAVDILAGYNEGLRLIEGQQ